MIGLFQSRAPPGGFPSLPPGRAPLFYCAFPFAAVFLAGFFGAGFSAFLAVVLAARLGVFLTHSRKNTELPGRVRLTLCSQPCMGTSWVLMALPLVTPWPPKALSSEENTSAQVPRMGTPMQ